MDTRGLTLTGCELPYGNPHQLQPFLQGQCFLEDPVLPVVQGSLDRLSCQGCHFLQGPLFVQTVSQADQVHPFDPEQRQVVLKQQTHITRNSLMRKCNKAVGDNVVIIRRGSTVTTSYYSQINHLCHSWQETSTLGSLFPWGP